MSGPFIDVFTPVEGAALDLASLESVAAAHDELLGAYLRVAAPGSSAVILDGLELEGDWSAVGPPGTVRPDSRSEGATVSPGTALLTGRDGRRFLIHIEQPLFTKWPTAAGTAVQGVLVLVPEAQQESPGGALQVARQRVRVVMGFVKPEMMEEPHLLPLASSIGNGRDWAMDLSRVLQPEHAAMQSLLKRFESLERLVWRAEPEGSVWERQVLGRNWVRYQTMAAASLQAARMALASRATTTPDRVRVLNALFEQLNISVERAATELLQLIGAEGGAGPYTGVGARTLRDGS